jgi:hypothetical protein
MKIAHWIAIVTLLTLNTALFAQEVRPHGLSRSEGKALQTPNDAKASDNGNKIADEMDLLEQSREAGLLTDWHLEGRFGHGKGDDFTRRFVPEHEAAKQAATHDTSFERRQYELVFPQGTFALPRELASRSGVFYANSSMYLAGGGEWNVYLESGAEAAVFVDGRRVLTRGPKATGVLRGKIHVESGYHSVMVKFIAKAAPFRVAILPLNSGSRRKNNTPYLQASPVSEYMMAKVSAMSPGKPVNY